MVYEAQNQFHLVYLICLTVLVDRKEMHAMDDFLTFRAHGEADEVVGCAAQFLVHVDQVVERACQWVVSCVWSGAVNWKHLYAGCVDISQSNIADAIWILGDLRSDLLVTGHLLSLRAIIARVHAQLLEYCLGA